MKLTEKVISSFTSFNNSFTIGWFSTYTTILPFDFHPFMVGLDIIIVLKKGFKELDFATSLSHKYSKLIPTRLLYFLPVKNTIIDEGMESKKFVKHETFGNSHRYYPIISKEDYRKGYFSLATQNYFENSYKNVVSFFAKEEKISADELREIIKIIEHKNS
jgi:hypothetical protein